MELQSISKRNKLIFGIIIVSCVTLLILYNILNSYLDDKLAAKLNKDKNEIVALISSNSFFDLKIIQEDKIAYTIHFIIKNSQLDNYSSDDIYNNHRFDVEQVYVKYKSDNPYFYLSNNPYTYEQKTKWDGRFNVFENARLEELNGYNLVLCFHSPECESGWTVDDKTNKYIEKHFYEIFIKLNFNSLNETSLITKIKLLNKKEKLLNFDKIFNQDYPIRMVSKLYAKSITGVDDFVPIYKFDEIFKDSWIEYLNGTINISLKTGISNNQNNTADVITSTTYESGTVVDSSSTLQESASTPPTKYNGIIHSTSKDVPFTAYLNFNDINGKVTGYYYYLSTQKKVDVSGVVNVTVDENTHQSTSGNFNGYDNGVLIDKFEFYMLPGSSIIQGTWKSVDGNKQADFELNADNTDIGKHD